MICRLNQKPGIAQYLTYGMGMGKGEVQQDISTIALPTAVLLLMLNEAVN
jgi:hypothetical protein